MLRPPWLLLGLALALGAWAVTRPRWLVPAEGVRYLPLIHAAAKTYNVPFLLLARLLWQESHFDPRAVNRTSGAQGIAQFMPATSRELGIDPFDPQQAIPAAALYLSQIREYLGTRTWGPVLAGYNWGMGNVQRAMVNAGSAWLTRAPAETRKYVAEISADVGLA